MNSNWGQVLPILSQATNIVARIYTVLMTILVIVPFYPNFPKPELDPSWSLGLNEAVSKSLQFGSDIIFTFGPYSSLATKYYHPDTYALIFFTSLILAAIYAFFAYQSLKESTVAMAMYAILLPTISHYSMDVMFLCFPLLYLSNLENGEKEILKICLFSFFAGVTIFIKGSYFITYGLIISLILLYNIYNKKYKIVMYYTILIISSSFFYWIISGQDAKSVFDYFIHLVVITDGYSESMSYYGSYFNIFLFLVCISIIVSYVNHSRRSTKFKILLTAAYLITSFLLFKAGFVRQDDHIRNASTGLFLLSLYSLINAEKYFYMQLCVVVLLSSIMLGNVFNKYQNPILYNFKNCFYNVQVAYANYKSNFEEYGNMFNEKLEVVRINTRLPKVSGSTDLYNHDLALLIASDNDWHPRPIFQSYAAYSPELASINRNHLLLDPPDNIFIRVKTIDNRLPTLDDGSSWPIFLSSYKPDSIYGSYLHLVKRDSVYLPSYKIFYDGQHKLNEFIRLPDKDVPAFATIQIHKTVIGSLKNIAYKPEPLYMTLYFDDGTKESFRYIASMGESPFLISPFVSNTTEFLQLFDSKNTNKRVTFFSLFNNGLGTDWDQTFRLVLRFYEKK
jgi:hypothetical protein